MEKGILQLGKDSYNCSLEGLVEGALLLQVKQIFTSTHVSLEVIPPEGRGIEQKIFDSLSWLFL